MKFRRKEFRFVRQLWTIERVCAYPVKVKAVQNMPTLTNVSGVRRCVGFITNIKFLPRLVICAKLLENLPYKMSIGAGLRLMSEPYK